MTILSLMRPKSQKPLTMPRKVLQMSFKQRPMLLSLLLEPLLLWPLPKMTRQRMLPQRQQLMLPLLKPSKRPSLKSRP